MSINIIVYFLGIALLILLSISHRYLDKVLALLVASMIFYFAAFRGGGIDYANYIDIVKGVQAADSTSFIAMFTAAKDPLFALLIMLSGLLSDNVVFPIVLLVLIAVMSKLAYTLKFIKYKTIFLGVYGVFLAPGLEFAAIRAAAGLAFLLFFIEPLSKKVRYFSVVISILSHIQFLPVLIIMVFSKKFSIKKVVIASILLAVFTHLILANITLLPFERSNDYADNKGTIIAAAPVIISLSIFLFSFPRKYFAIASRHYYTQMALYRAALMLIIMSFGASYSAVTISTRLLEIGWFLMLPLYINFFELQRSARLWFGFISYIFFLGAINIYRVTWIAFDEFLLFQW